jgi:hypothetical protein
VSTTIVGKWLWPFDRMDRAKADIDVPVSVHNPKDICTCRVHRCCGPGFQGQVVIGLLKEVGPTVDGVSVESTRDGRNRIAHDAQVSSVSGARSIRKVLIRALYVESDASE